MRLLPFTEVGAWVKWPSTILVDSRRFASLNLVEKIISARAKKGDKKSPTKSNDNNLAGAFDDRIGWQLFFIVKQLSIL